MQQSAPALSQFHKNVNGRSPDLVDLSVIIVNYNVREFLEQALRSVERASIGLTVEVFIVDNNSVDGSVEMVQSRFPNVTVIANKKNAGFSVANNQAIRQARGRYLLILNPDTLVREDTFTKLVQFMDEHPEAGAVGCKILNPDGSFALESRRSFPTPSVAFYRVVGLSRLFPRSKIFGRYNLTYLSVDQVSEVDALSGSCMLVRHAALYFSPDEVASREASEKPVDLELPPRSESETGHGAGLFDENFFMYGEDLDWCFRIQLAGWKIYYTPDTQIIHFKGESTKKGELRYVKLFYGAMLRFTEKHFESRYSRLFAHLLRAAIVSRAAISMTGNLIRRLRMLLFDFALVYMVVALFGAARSAEAGVGTSFLFFLSVAPAYSLASVLGIAAAGGYRYRRRYRIRPVLSGVTAAFLIVATVSFFVRDIAFSRAVVLLSYPSAIAILSVYRVALQRRRKDTRRALLVGKTAEAQRLQEMLDNHPTPPFNLVGYILPVNRRPEGLTMDPLCLGTIRQLRDLVRLRNIDDVVFASNDVTNHLTFRLIQQLQDLPVQFKILTEGNNQIIGKASVEDLSMPALLELDEALGEIRGTAARRVFELVLATAGTALHPFIWIAARLSGHKGLLLLARRTRQLPLVISGRLALVGFYPGEGVDLPDEWDLKPGVFSITNAFPRRDLTPQEAKRAYWFYTRNQSSALDWDIILRSVHNLMMQ